ncbi:hypothetical protein [Nannocystis sp.]|uniref:tetratricopeptide repeat protein n=1 Tax=Nannocystis sp. TaxID=1962667 RepID=UPI0025CFD3E3|nr:hypothetical protein [Nannocystis sp.]MBK7829902.1 hypothetical protein [Nannocystis sp.]
MRSRLVRLALVTITVCTATACQTPSPEGAKKDVVDATKKADAKPADAKQASPDLKTADPTPTPATGANGTAASADTAATAGTATAPGTAGDPSAGDPTAADPTPTGGDAATPPTDPAAAAADKAKLLGEVKAKKTSDTRAKKALEEAEAAGATVRELAEASNARGEALMGAGEAERATAAFVWARDKDTTYPDPSFNLARLTVNAGDVAETVAHLKEVHKRGGKKLLKQVGFDPSFEIVKDDPEVSKLIK